MNAGEIIQGRYRLEEALGRGGMATVWRAHDLRLERSVALKCLTAPLADDPEYLVRFFAEAQQVARLSHPNVVRVLDFGQGDECPYLVMEYLPGGSMVELTGSPVDPERATSLIAGAARGAGAAHSAGLVHRDLKPGNILLTEDGTPKLADFGIAVTDAQERLTATGTAIGSPHYVSPEQASGRPVGPQSDVYSLGVVLYELLTGRRPFENDNVMALAIAHVEEEADPPSAHKPELAPEIDAAVMRCLAKDPEERFANGDEMATALDRLGTESATAALAPAGVATAGTASEENVEEPPAVGNARRVVSVSLLVALFLGLLVFGVMALGDDGGRDEERAVADVDQDGSVNAKESPSKDRSASDAEEDPVEGEASTVDGAETPSPTPTKKTEDEAKTETVAKETTDQTEEQEEPVEEPTPEPTSEPTEEPAPDPTPTPYPDGVTGTSKFVRGHVTMASVINVRSLARSSVS